MRPWLLAAPLVIGCLDSPPASVAADAHPGDAALPVCACPEEPCGFSRARPIAISTAGLGEELVQVPVLVRFEVSPNMAAAGADLRFFDAEGDLLPYEVELFPPEGTAAVWVGVPSIRPDENAELCLFYGSSDPGSASPPTDVWDSGFAGVWHLGDEAITYADSTAHACDGTGGDGDSIEAPTPAESLIGNGQLFGGNQAIAFGTEAHLDLTGSAITMETWALASTIGPSYQALLGKEGYFSGYRTLLGATGEVLFQLTYDGRHMQTPTGTVNSDEWHYLVATYDGSEMRIYVDGLLVKEYGAVGPIESNEVPLLAGVSNDDYFFTGVLDELRLSSVARSADWIALQFGAVTGDLVSVGDEQAL